MQPNRLNPQAGFTLFEVLMAVAILSVSFVILLQTHIRGVDIETRSREITVATNLAKEKMSELEIRGPSVIGNQFSQADSRYPGYKWELSLKPLSFPGLSEATLIVYTESGEERNDVVTLRTLVTEEER